MDASPGECACGGRNPVGSVTLSPAGSQWAGLVRAGELSELARETRRALGLPLDRPVVMSGHQAEFWHPGILAKWIAGVAVARAVGGVFAWLHVDQDTNTPTVIRYPALDERGTLAARTMTLAEPMRDVPVCAAGSVKTRMDVPRDVATESVREGLRAMLGAIADHAGVPSLGDQFAGALHAVLEPRFGGAARLTATALSRTPGFAWLVDELARDPVRAIEAYNEAAARHPEAEIRPLGVKAGTPPRVELPLWRVRAGSPHLPVMLSSLASIPREELRPKALLMTAAARLFACDLFIHGTGGGAYDRVTDAWLEAWLGRRDSAPAVVATATRTLEFGEGHGGVCEQEALAARQAVHRACHDPALLGDAQGAARKRDLVARIAATGDRQARAALFREMHDLLGDVRQAHGDARARLRERAETIQRRAAEEPVVRDRTWAFPMYPAETLESLREAIERELGVHTLSGR